MTATQLAESVQLAESTDLAEAAPGQLTGRRQLLKLITVGWGSSGYYSEAALQQAARDRIWPAGTHMYLNHPSLTESVELPERKVEDLAAVLATDPVYRDGALWAESEVFTPFLWLAEKKNAIGVSIRASGTTEPGEAEGRHGTIVTSLTEGISVDYVTRAGRGGEIVELLESSRQAVREGASSQELREAGTFGAWLESRIHLLFTEIADNEYGCGRLTRTERIALSSAIGDALAVFVSRIETDHPQIYTRGRWQDPEPEQAAMSEAAEPAEESVPDEQPAEQDPEPDTTADAEPDPVEAPEEPGTPPVDNKEEGTVPELTEAQLAELNKERDDALAEAANAKALAEAAAARQAESDLRLARFEAVEAARPIAATLLAESDLPAPARAKVLGAVTESATVPLRDGALDESAFRTRVTDAIQTERTYVASLAEQAGAGQPRDLGESAPAAQPGVEGTKDALVELYLSRGLSESAARLAASGRGA